MALKNQIRSERLKSGEPAIELMKIFTVSELTSSIKALLEPNFRSISVQGEISNFKLQSSGHLYFSLKDAGSQISSVLFKGSAAGLSRMPKEGDQVIAKGEISLYAPRGSYQIIIRELQFLGVGELLLKLHQLKEELQKRGWFSSEHKKPLPRLPKRIGVVTSPTGAVIQDILHVLTRRFSGFHVILNPVKVQGEGASSEIAKAIDDFNKHDLADVLIVGRGGGSIEDLWAFNEEIVAKAIFESRIPIISAIGHETDFTIADWVADVRAPTPSAAAEIAIAEKEHLLQFLERAQESAKQRIAQLIHQYRKQLAALQKHPLLSSPYGILAPMYQRVDDYSRRLELVHPSEKIRESKEKLKKVQEHPFFSSPRALLDPTLQKVEEYKRRLKLVHPSQKIRDAKEKLKKIQEHPFFSSPRVLLDPVIQKVEEYSRRLEFVHPREKIEEARDKLRRVEEHLRAIHPRHLLKKGYAILFSEKDDSIILSAEKMAPGTGFKALLHDGQISATTTEVTKHDPRNSLF